MSSAWDASGAALPAAAADEEPPHPELAGADAGILAVPEQGVPERDAFLERRLVRPERQAVAAELCRLAAVQSAEQLCAGPALAAEQARAEVPPCEVEIAVQQMP